MAKKKKIDFTKGSILEHSNGKRYKVVSEIRRTQDDLETGVKAIITKKDGTETLGRLTKWISTSEFEQSEDTKPKSKKEGNTTRFKTITAAIYDLLEKKGPTNVTVEEATEVARKVKPDTKFNKWHLYFHRRGYREKYPERAAAEHDEDDNEDDE